jgi:hypothetical protein
LTELLHAEAAGNDGDEEDRESLRGDPGEEKVKRVAADGSHLLTAKHAKAAKKNVF